MSDDLRKGLQIGLIALGAILLALCAVLLVDARLFQARLADRLDSLRRSTADSRDVAHATRREARTTGLVGRLEVPRLRLSTLVVEGTDAKALRRAAGHVERTAFPGERGNVGIAGHRDTHFRTLQHVAEGDRIRLDTPDGLYEYRVDSILVVPPERADLLDPSDEERLTLVTCYPFHWVGLAPKRFVVLARPAEAKVELEAVRVVP